MQESVLQYHLGPCTNEQNFEAEQVQKGFE